MKFRIGPIEIRVFNWKKEERAATGLVQERFEQTMRMAEELSKTLSAHLEDLNRIITEGPSLEQRYQAAQAMAREAEMYRMRAQIADPKYLEPDPKYLEPDPRNPEHHSFEEK